MERCALCGRAGTAQNSLNKHHVRGKKYPLIMVVHSKSCHLFAQWLTNLYLLDGRESELTEEFTIYFFNRVVTLRDKESFILDVYR